MDKELQESMIQGLMIMGRTREEALKEIAENEENRYRQMERELWDYDPRTGKRW